MAEKDRNDKHTRNENPEQRQRDEDTDPEELPVERLDNPDDRELGFLRVDTDTNQVQDNALDPELDSDSIQIGTNEDAVMNLIDDFTDDPEILEDFAERQRIDSGSEQLLSQFKEHNSRSPDLTGDDIDADWNSGAYQTGEETVGGTNPTPDQDIVEELGEAAGLNYEYDEELNTLDKLTRRDEARWEMNPASADELEEDLEEAGKEENDLPRDPEDFLSDDTLDELDNF
jgi:hypothetical protein